MEASDDPVTNPVLLGRMRRYAKEMDKGTFKTLWPYVDATSYEQKQWLATIAASDHRPWQVNSLLIGALQDAANFPPLIIVGEKDQFDIFAGANGDTV